MRILALPFGVGDGSRPRQPRKRQHQVTIRSLNPRGIHRLWSSAAEYRDCIISLDRLLGDMASAHRRCSARCRSSAVSLVSCAPSRSRCARVKYCRSALVVRARRSLLQRDAAQEAHCSTECEPERAKEMAAARVRRMQPLRIRTLPRKTGHWYFGGGKKAPFALGASNASLPSALLLSWLCSAGADSVGGEAVSILVVEARDGGCNALECATDDDGDDGDEASSGVCKTALWSVCTRATASSPSPCHCIGSESRVKGAGESISTCAHAAESTASANAQDDHGGLSPTWRQSTQHSRRTASASRCDLGAAPTLANPSSTALSV
eukprot:2706939-Pleurochrysis_carterae.AAC.4